MRVHVNKTDITLSAETDLEKAFFEYYGKEPDGSYEVFRLNSGDGECSGMCIRQKVSEV